MSSFRHQLYRFRTEVRKASSYPPLPAPALVLWKYFFRWRRDQKPGHNSLDDKQPWLNYFVIRFLEKNISPSAKVFEYGGGGSTLFFLFRIGVKELVTVEHNQLWFDLLFKKIPTENQKSWKGILVSPEKNETGGSPSNPLAYISADADSVGMQFRKYASAIDQFTAEYFDLVVVDGRSRPSCLLHAIPKVKRGGLLILDNSERSYYLENMKDSLHVNFEVILDGFGPVPYGEWFSRTTIWRKK